MACFIRRTCYLFPRASLILASSLLKPIFGLFPGVPSSLFAGAKLFNFGNGWWKYPYHVFPAAGYARLHHAFSFTPSTPDSQAFNWVPTPSSDPQIFTYALFLRKLRDHLSLIGIDPTLHAGHSFHRGGASFAYQSGVPIELIKALGDWRSDTILIYLTMPLTIRLKTANMLCKSILSHST